MQEQKGRWEKLAQECKSAIDTSSKALAQMNKENQEKQAKEDDNVAKFCKKYNSIAQNPVGGCNKAKELAEISDQVSSRLSNQALTLSEQYASACDGFNNESDSPPTSCEDLTGSDLKVCRQKQSDFSSKGNSSGGLQKTQTLRLSSLCKKTSDSSYSSDKEFIASSIKRLAPADREKLSGIDDIGDLITKIDDEGIEDNGFFADIYDFAGPETKSADKLCQRLMNPAGKSLAELEREKSELEVTLSTADAKDEKKLNLDLSKLKDQITKATAGDAERKKERDRILEELASINATPDPTSKVAKVNEMKKIGEQMEGACDVQNNSTLTKNTGFDLGAFDRQYLGQGTSSR
jgi:hypothetical protein